MKDSEVMQGDDIVFELPAVMQIPQAATLLPDFQALLASKRVVLEAAALQAIDTTGLQLLLSLVESAEQRGIVLEWRSPSPALVRAVERAGLVSRLGW